MENGEEVLPMSKDWSLVANPDATRDMISERRKMGIHFIDKEHSA
jgi:hypothetical protein